MINKCPGIALLASVARHFRLWYCIIMIIISGDGYVARVRQVRIVVVPIEEFLSLPHILCAQSLILGCKLTDVFDGWAA